MKKFTGNYSSDAGKALKSAGGRIFCKVDDFAVLFFSVPYRFVSSSTFMLNTADNKV